jgi:hypothetical protein
MKRWVGLVLVGLTAVAPAQVLRIPRRVPVRTDKVAPDVPAMDADPAFPLRVHLAVAKFGGAGSRYHGYGSGNLLDAKGPEGFDYAFDCEVAFVPNGAPDETYQARWRKQGYELEILMNDAGTRYVDTCALRLAMKERPFVPEDTARMVHGVSSSIVVPWHDPGFAYELADPDYPIHFHVLDGLRMEDNAGDHGWGTANLYDPAVQGGPLQGAQYTYDCGRGFLTNSQLSGFYQGHWVKPGAELEVLLQRAGSDKVDKCKVRVNLQAQPYAEVRGMQEPVGAGVAAPTGQVAAPIVREAPGTP